MASPWTWSQEHQNYYQWILDANGNRVCVWAQQRDTPFQQTNNYQQPTSNGAHQQQQIPNANGFTHAGAQQPLSYAQPATSHAVTPYGPSANRERNDSVVACDPNMAPSAPPEVRSRHPNLFQGTPHRGWYDIDPSYRMRTGREAHEFFKRGRVFSMLWSEAASETMARTGTENSAITIGRFGQSVFSQIRRFVVVRSKRDRNFVYACAIFTYSGRGTLKHGCNPSEHTIVHLRGTDPMYYQGEYENGMTKEPIEIIPTNRDEEMEPASRLRFGKVYPVEWNVKVKDIGKVSPRDMPKLMAYYKEEEENGDSDG